MVHGDPFVALSLCAKATRHIRLGIGVTSPALRSAPAAASGFAGLNALAPGRIICGVGTGNTARRTLGMRPTTAATLENFTAALQDLCAGHTIEYREGDRVRDIRFLHTGGPSLMNILALVGTRDDLRARITTLERAGIDELLIQPVIDPPTEMARLAELLT